MAIIVTGRRWIPWPSTYMSINVRSYPFGGPIQRALIGPVAWRVLKGKDFLFLDKNLDHFHPTQRADQSKGGHKFIRVGSDTILHFEPGQQDLRL